MTKGHNIPFLQIATSCFFNMLNYQGTTCIWHGIIFATMGWSAILPVLMFYVFAVASDLMVIECLRYHPHCSSMGELVGCIMGEKYRYYIEVIANVELFVYTIASAIVLGSNFHQLALPSWRIEDAIILATFLTLPVQYFAKIDGLARLSFLGLTAVCLTLILVFISGCLNDDSSNFSDPAKNTAVFTSGLKFTNSLGLTMLAFANQSMIPSVTREIRVAYQNGKGVTPDSDYVSDTIKYSKLCVISSSTMSLILNLAVGMMAYRLYGSSMFDIVTLNFSNPVVSRIGWAVLAVTYFTKVPMILWPVGFGIESFLDKLKWGELVGESLANWPNFKYVIRAVNRTVLVVIVALLASSIAVLSFIMAVGATLLAYVTMYLMPAICYMQLSNDVKSGKIKSRVGYTVKSHESVSMTVEMVDLNKATASGESYDEQDQVDKVYVPLNPIEISSFKYYCIVALTVTTFLTSLYSTIFSAVKGP